MNLLYLMHDGVRRAGYFASWARPKKGDLNIPRKKYLAQNESVVWNIGEESGECADHIEMAGFYSASIISYGKDKYGNLRLHRHISIPKLRVQPNETGCSFSFNVDKPAVKITVNGVSANEQPKTVSIKGNLEINSYEENGVKITRTFTPAVNQPALIEMVAVTNESDLNAELELSGKASVKYLPLYFCTGDKRIKSVSACSETDELNENNTLNKKLTLKAGESHTHYCVYYAVCEGEASYILYFK